MQNAPAGVVKIDELAFGEQPVRSMGVGWRFQSFKINDLELVVQICPRWNRLQPWFELVGAFKDAA